MKTSDVISVAMSSQDGARAAAELRADGRIKDVPHHCEAFHTGFLAVALECLWAGGEPLN
jgi:hypothetical protein